MLTPSASVPTDKLMQLYAGQFSCLPNDVIVVVVQQILVGEPYTNERSPQLLKNMQRLDANYQPLNIKWILSLGLTCHRMSLIYNDFIPQYICSFCTLAFKKLHLINMSLVNNQYETELRIFERQRVLKEHLNHLKHITQSEIDLFNNTLGTLNNQKTKLVGETAQLQSEIVEAKKIHSFLHKKFGKKKR